MQSLFIFLHRTQGWGVLEENNNFGFHNSVQILNTTSKFYSVSQPTSQSASQQVSQSDIVIHSVIQPFIHSFIYLFSQSFVVSQSQSQSFIHSVIVIHSVSQLIIRSQSVIVIVIFIHSFSQPISPFIHSVSPVNRSVSQSVQ